MSEIVLHKRCPVCDHNKLDHFLSVEDHFCSSEKFNLDKCSICTLVLTNPRPIDELLPPYYDSVNYISHSANAKGLINSLYKQAQTFNMWMKFHSIKSEVPRGTWLDYGCGNGAFMSYLIKKKLTIHGYEPNELAFEAAYTANPNTFNSPTKLPEGTKYATIMMWHVLEHIPNPLEILRAHFDRLSDNGILVIALPNYESLDAQLYQKYWAAYDVPRHLWHFTQKALEELVSNAGFEIIKTKPLYLDAFYIALLSEKYMRGSMVRGILNALRSNLKAAFSSTPYSSQIYILRKKAK